MSPQRLGQMVKKLRQRKRLTQVALAAKAEVTQGYIAKLESGMLANPSLDVARRLAKALRVDLKRLL